MRVVFTSVSGSPKLSVLHGEPAIPSGGIGSWEVVPRPRRLSLTRWLGREPLRMSIPIMFDSHIENQSVEDDIDLLMKLASPADDHLPPPRMTIVGAVPFRGKVWVIEGIDWGANILWQSRGEIRYRTRQDATVHALQYVAADYVRRAGGSDDAPVGQGIPSRYVVKPGDTLPSIAIKFYNDREMWKAIAKLNRLDDVRKIRPGQGIALPRPERTVR